TEVHIELGESIKSQILSTVLGLNVGTSRQLEQVPYSQRQILTINPSLMVLTAATASLPSRCYSSPQDSKRRPTNQSGFIHRGARIDTPTKSSETSSSSNSNSSSADMRSHQFNLSALCSILTCLCGPSLFVWAKALQSGQASLPVADPHYSLSIAFALIYALDSMLGASETGRFYAPPMRLSWPMAVCLSVLLGTAASQLHGNYRVRLSHVMTLEEGFGRSSHVTHQENTHVTYSGRPVRCKAGLAVRQQANAFEHQLRNDAKHETLGPAGQRAALLTHAVDIQPRFSPIIGKLLLFGGSCSATNIRKTVIDSSVVMPMFVASICSVVKLMSNSLSENVHEPKSMLQNWVSNGKYFTSMMQADSKIFVDNQLTLPSFCTIALVLSVARL
uniref:ABC2_membrane domain-containing protein n=1 Tax=Macrostomum lignano TaxID=282301 RepID=A0A1I8ISJ4_9PLAT